MERWEIVLVGAGAAGLMAAWRAARELGTGKVLLLEGNGKPGKKLLATGNGRCNLTNLGAEPCRYHGDRDLAAPLLAQYPPARVLEAFRAMGLVCREDGEGRVYPYNFQAAAVLQALWTACQEAGVQARWDSPVTGVRREKGGFLLETAGREKLFARQCLLCAGGKASPKHSKGEGYSLAEGLGHQVTALRPSLAPLKSPAKCLRSLKGMRARAKAGLYRRGRLVWEESGEVQFGDGALSGICVFDLSARLEGPGPWEVRLDLAEDWEEAQALGYLKDPAPAAPPPPGRGPAGGVSQSAGGLGAGEALRPRWGPAPGPDRGQAAGGRCQAHQELGLPGDRAGALGERPGHPGRGAPGGGGPGDAGIETLPRAVPDRGTVKRGRGLRWL